MKKLLISIISIVITIVGTVLVGLYDYNVYLNPEGKNSSRFQGEYKSYISEQYLVITGDYENQTEDRIKLNELFSNYYYNEEPIYKKDIIFKEKRLFTIVVYKNISKYVPNTTTDQLRYRYDTYIYNIDYVALKESFINKETQVPNETTIKKADYPEIIINFYPNDLYNSDESLYCPHSVDDTTYTYNLINANGTSKYFGSQLNNTSHQFTLVDYASNPEYNENNDLYSAKSLVFYDYTFTGTSNFDDNTNLFENGAYVKVDAYIETTSDSEQKLYTLSESLLKDHIEEMEFNLTGDELDTSNYEKGCLTTSNVRDMLNNIDISTSNGKVKNYSQWVIGKYLWWHCAISFVVIGAIMTGFYFTFTYEENSKKKIVRKNKKKK